MAKKISLWISTLFTPITKPPSRDRFTEEDEDEILSSFSIPWSTSDETASTLVSTSPQLDRKMERKESIGAGVVVRELLIKDLE